MKRSILIFEPDLNGHHLEYTYHLYNRTFSYPENNFTFILPDSFIDLKQKFDWKKSLNVTFDLVSKKEIEVQNSRFIHNPFLQAFKKVCLLRRKVKEHKANYIFLNSLMTLLPFLTILLPKNVKVSGIVYRIYLYRWKTSSVLGKLSDVLKYLILVKSKKISNIFILNDNSASAYLNKIYSTTKFKLVADPFINTNHKLKNLREELRIPSTSKVMLHFGSLTKRKGTLDILECIDLLPKDSINDYSFIFAGKINTEIRDSFYNKYRSLQEKCQILVFDQFCEYSFFANLCHISDCILIPYKNIIQSSGIIGYAAQFKTPVISSHEGLLGKLVKRNKLGWCIQGITPLKLANFISSFEKNSYIVSTKYLETNTSSNFSLTLFDFD